MAAANFTPISLYYTTSALTVPSAGNLINGELALNITDGKLYFKNNSGVVKLLAGSSEGPAAGLNNQVQYNSVGVLAASANFTFDGVNISLAGVTVGLGPGGIAASNATLGVGAMAANTGGDNNVAVGTAACAGITSGGFNTAVGANALQTASTASNNVAIGQTAANLLTSSNNTAIGTGALSAATNGSTNTALGYFSGSTITTGSYNVILGGFNGNSNGLDIRAANQYAVVSDGLGNPRATYNGTGVGFYTQGAITTKAATATLTGAEVLTGILNTTGSSYGVIMPSGTALDTATGGMPTDTGFIFVVINTASGTITMSVSGGGITTVGTLTVLTGISARFLLRKTAANTFVMYRV